MALKEILPYRDEIIAMKEPPNVRTYDEVVGNLIDQYGLTVSKPTVTRFLRLHAPHLVNSRSLTPEEERASIPFETFMRVEQYIKEMKEEQRIQFSALFERMGSKMAVMSAEIAELEKTISQLKKDSTSSEQVSPTLLRRIWFRALIVTSTISTIAFILIWFMLKT